MRAGLLSLGIEERCRDVLWVWKEPTIEQMLMETRRGWGERREWVPAGKLSGGESIAPDCSNASAP